MCIIHLMLVIGLTGNYGMGKSTVLPIFKKLGALTVDTDKIVKRLLTRKLILKKIRSVFGKEVFNDDGSLNREKIADLVFTDDTMRRYLEDILHPVVFDEIERYLKKRKNKYQIAIIEIPLLFERGYQDRFDQTIVIHTKENVAIKRLENQGINRERALMRLRSQIPIELKIEKADYLIDNNGAIQNTKAQIKIIYEKLMKEVKNEYHQRT
ncbi:MAG: dephospho-CoA kinase [Nitrospirae bacterium]|nr:dephospho-CoA kinase [Nitrospirota bacterium]